MANGKTQSQPWKHKIQPVPNVQRQTKLIHRQKMKKAIQPWTETSLAEVWQVSIVTWSWRHNYFIFKPCKVSFFRIFYCFLVFPTMLKWIVSMKGTIDQLTNELHQVPAIACFSGIIDILGSPFHICDSFGNLSKVSPKVTILPWLHTRRLSWKGPAKQSCFLWCITVSKG